jgi:hypothetical protein
MLDGIAVTSASNAWAVGSTSAVRSGALILRWNGATWKQVALPRLGGGSSWLSAVAASSATNAWAVGAIGGLNLILHWNGRSWYRVPCPSPRRNYALVSVTVTRSGGAWAVGFSYSSDGPVDDILRWIHGAWQRVSNPVPLESGLQGAGTLQGVSASSARDAWAVGTGAPGFRTMTAHWNGSVWRQVPTPDVLGGALAAVATAPHGEAWAVGRAEGRASVLIMHWNGRSWRRVSSPSPAGGELTSVTSLPDGTAFAAGSTASGGPLILHWNGHSWRRQPAPVVSVSGVSDDFLSGIGASSPSDAWAIGYTGGGGGLVLRWNGAAWR